MEDDYEFKLDYFDKIHIDIIKKDKNIGWLCGLASDMGYKVVHAAMAGGCIRSAALEKLWQNNNNAIFPCPFDNLALKKSPSYQMVQYYGQIGISLGMVKNGYKISDLKEHYSIIYKHAKGTSHIYNENKKIIMGPNY